ncbi:MAG: DUF6163 family protein [Pseudomonadota bacterium]
MPRSFSPQPLEPIRVTSASPAPERPTERWFYIMLRGVGVLLIARGLYIWFCFTGLMPEVAPAYALSVESDLEFALLAGSAVASLIAGLGLWLLAAWGAVLWLVLVAFDALLFFLVPELAAVRPFVVVANGVLVTAYIVMALIVRRGVRAQATI